MTLFFVFSYCILMLALGCFANKNSGSFAEYILGGRSFGPIIIGISCIASDVSVGTFTVVMSMIYKFGASRMWMDVSFFVFTVLCWKLISKKLRVLSAKLDNAVTIPQYFARRFNDATVGFISAIIIVFFLTFYIASNFLGFAKVMHDTLNVPVTTSYLCVFLITVTYVTMGGFRATCITDILQGLIMIAVSVILPAILAFKLGIEPLLDAISMRPQTSSANVNQQELLRTLIYLSFGLCTFGNVNLMTKFMAAKSYQSLNQARNISVSMHLLMYIGLATSAFYAVSVLDYAKDSEVILFQLSKAFLNPALNAMVVCAMIAAMMSTVDSLLIICSGCITSDIYCRFAKYKNSAHLVRVTRVMTVLVSVIALLASVFFSKSVLKLAILAVAGLGSSIGPLMLFSIYKNSVSSLSAKLGLICPAMLVLCSFLFFDLKDPHYIFLPSFLLSLLVILVSEYKSLYFFTYKKLN